jgi:hypothetical protein
MSRLREHVHDTCCAQFEAVLVDQYSRISRQTAWMTRNINNAVSAALRDDR